MTDDATRSTVIPRVAEPQLAAVASRPARLRELSPKTMWLTAAVIAVLTAAAVVVLWWPATAGLNGADLVSARLDSLKVGLSVAVGSGGVVALYLSWRRQHSTEADLDNRERALGHQQEVHAANVAHQDRVARATEHDAAERRLSELYLKAVEQLGSPQAAVRHGGLYALERVAQDNSHQRQTVVNVICAYLRNPYTPPPEPGECRPMGIRRSLLRSAAASSSSTTSREGDREARLQEREVRLTAQRILQLHLQPGTGPDRHRPSFWDDIDIDLTGATLINFCLRGCTVRSSTFTEATFVGDADFVEVIFNDGAAFGGATFGGFAGFGGATFTGVRFGGVTFSSDAEFTGVSFGDFAGFGEVTFSGGARFAGATFSGGDFDGATFSGDAEFAGATFTGDVSSAKVTFSSAARFTGVTFCGDACFSRVTFSGIAGFSAVRFCRDGSFSMAMFSGVAFFDGVTVGRGAGFAGAMFSGDAWFSKATFSLDAVFNGATFTGDSKFDGATLRGVAFDPMNRGVRSLDGGVDLVPGAT